MTIALSGLLAFGATTALHAQDNSAQPQQQGQWGGGHHRGGMNPDEQLKHMTKELGLSSDQQSQILPVLQERQQKMQAIREDQSLSHEDRRSKMMALRTDSEGKIQALLTDQQKQKYQAMQERRGDRGQGQGGDSTPPSSQPQPQ
ncbi:MAG: hypothetical protein WA414_05315 [Acidobacteriaceae bacterium]